jgi:hypothetical protein
MGNGCPAALSCCLEDNTQALCVTVSHKEEEAGYCTTSSLESLRCVKCVSGFAKSQGSGPLPFAGVVVQY